MALINRLNRLFRADLHAVLDRIEEPEALLRESVREMAAAIEADQRGLQQLTQRESELGRQQQQLNDSLEKLAQELDVCFVAEQDQLARGLIKRRLQTQQRLDELNQGQQQAQLQVSEFTERLQHNRSRLEAIEQKLALVVSSESMSRTAQTHQIDQQDSHVFRRFDSATVIDEAAVEVAYLAEQQRRAS